MPPVIPGGVEHLQVGSVTEQRQGDRTFLLVQETPDQTSIIESWDDGFDVANRLLKRLNVTLENMNADMASFNERFTDALRDTGAKIAANQRLLDEIVKGNS